MKFEKVVAEQGRNPDATCVYSVARSMLLFCGTCIIKTSLPFNLSFILLVPFGWKPVWGFACHSRISLWATSSLVGVVSSCTLASFH